MASEGKVHFLICLVGGGGGGGTLSGTVSGGAGQWGANCSLWPGPGRPICKDTVSFTKPRLL